MASTTCVLFSRIIFYLVIYY